VFLKFGWNLVPSSTQTWQWKNPLPSGNLT
jgi:hypothetical protein